MKFWRWTSLCVLVCAFSMLIVFSCGYDDDDAEIDEKVDQFARNLEADDFTVQEGAAGTRSMLERCCATGTELDSCYGANPRSTYIIPMILNSPNQEIPNLPGSSDPSGTYDGGYRLDPNEAVVIIGKTPPKVKYFSYVPYVYIRYDGTNDKYVPIFATMTDALNLLTIKTSGTPDGVGNDPFNKDTILIASADQETDWRVRQAAVDAGFSESIMNSLIIPSEIARLGLEADKDTIMILNRTAVPPDTTDGKDNLNAYVESPGIRVFRASPNSSDVDPFATPNVTKRGSGTSENDLADSVATLKQAILDEYSDHNVEEYETKIWIPEGRECIKKNMECIGEIHDTIYLRMPGSTTDDPVAGPKLFTLSEDENDFLIVYGVNHAASGKALYHSISLYSNERLNGIETIRDGAFEGKASIFLPNDENVDKLFAVKVARKYSNSDEDIPCMKVPTGGCPVDDLENEYGAALDAELFLVMRAYVDPVSKVGPASDEIIYDKALHFTRK